MVNKVKGFSLVELLVVIALIGILATMATMGIVSFIRDATLSQMRDTLIANIEEAKARSITSVPHGIRFDVFGEFYDFVRLRDGRCSVTTAQQCATTLNDLGDGCPAGETCTTGNFTKDAGDLTTTLKTIIFGANYTCANSNGVELWFDRKGVPRDINWALGMTTITCSSGTQSKQLTISSSGRVQYEQ